MVCPVEISALKKSSHKFSRSSLSGDSPAIFSQYFEVLFLGEILASHQRAPPSFVDDSIKKLNQREKVCKPKENIYADTEVTPQNRTMILQIGLKDLRLISPDTQLVVLQANYWEVSHCSRGQQNREHFGFLCKSDEPVFKGYIFRCNTGYVVQDIMQGLRSAFQVARETTLKEQRGISCPTCPMTWYNNLCDEMNGASPTKAQEIILHNVAMLDDEECDAILLKMSTAETPPNMDVQNEILVQLKASCQSKQKNHYHSSTLNVFSEDVDTVIPPFTPYVDNKVITVAKRARKSLAESFNDIMKMASVDVNDIGGLLPTLSVVQPSLRKEITSKHAVDLPIEKSVTQKKLSSGESITSPRKLHSLTPSDGSYIGNETSRRRARSVGAVSGETMKRELAKKGIIRFKDQSVSWSDDAETNSMTTTFMKMVLRPKDSLEISNSRQEIFKVHIFQYL